MKTYTDKRPEAEKIIRNSVWWSLAVGTIPIPFLDLGSVSMIQMEMMRDLCKLYDVPFNEKELTSRFMALIGGSAPRVVSYVIKFIPIVGIVSKVSMPFMSALSTYSMGQVLLRHFEEGGKVLTFDVEAARSFYAESLQAGKKIVQEQLVRLKSKKNKDILVAEDIVWQ